MKINNAVVRTIDIITYLAQAGKSVTLSEIAHNCGIPKSSALDILYTLTDREIVEVDNAQFKTYKLTLRLLELGSRVFDSQNIQTAAYKILSDLAEKANTTVFLAVPQKTQVIYINKYEGNAAVQYACSVGDTNPMHLTGIGKAMLAAYSDEEIYALLGPGPYEKRTENSITSYDELIADLRMVRERGYSIDDREALDILYCFAAPIYDYNGKMVAATSMVSIYHTVSDSVKEEYPNMIKQAALDISRKLGYAADKLYL